MAQDPGYGSRMPFSPWISQPRHRALLALALLAIVEVLILVNGPDLGAAAKNIEAALAANERPKWEDLADKGIVLAAWVNLGLLALLAASVKLWLKPMSAVEKEIPAPKSLWQRWWLVPVALTFTVWYGTMSFGSKSLWWDEIWSLRQCTHGTWKEDAKAPDGIKFSPTDWKRCAFYYGKPTNHTSQSLLQKASLELWRKVTGAPREAFSEIAARAPAFLASGVAVALLLRVVGIARGLVLLGALLALHPWHLRYGVEARAYALVVPLCLSGILASRRVIATRGRSLRAWTWLSLNQALWIYTFIPAVLDVGLMFLLTLVWLWKQETNRADRISVITRHVVAHVFAAMLWMQAFLPNLVQIPHINEPGNAPQKADAGLLRTTATQMLFGMEWDRPHEGAIEAEHLTSVVEVARSSAAGAVVVLIAAVAASLGLYAGWKRTPIIGSLLLVPVGAALVHVTLSRLLGSYFYPRFIISMLPMVVAGWALFPQMLADYTQTQKKIGIAFMVAFAFFTAPQRGVLKAVSYSPYKEVAAYLDSQADQPAVAIFGLGREALPSYFPRAFGTSEVSELETFLAKAKAGSKRSLVVLGYPFFHQDVLPDGVKLLRDPKRFRELQAWPGLEADFYFRVFEALP